MVDVIRISTTPRHRAILWFGPAGSGNTPLGELLDRVACGAMAAITSILALEIFSSQL